jgi:D-arabinose 1-dehydrogenase-like Zn-dependent alcohol dehydrogenase
MHSYDLLEWGGALQERTRQTPVPRGGEVLLRVTHCGVCHTDVHIRDGYYDLGAGSRLAFADRGYRLPMTLGHEPVGIVEALGESAQGVRVGGAYVVNPWIGCGECAMCARGRDNLCTAMRPIGMGAHGGFATHVLVPDARYLVDIGDLDPAQAAPLACAGMTVYSAIAKLQPLAPEQWIAVIGCGGLGLMALALLRALHGERVIACDVDDAKLAAARERGARHTVNLARGGESALARSAGGALDGMLDFVGSGATVALALAALRKGGRSVICGLIGGAANVPVPLLALREIALLGSVVGTTQDLRDLVDLVRSGRVALPPVTCRPLDAADRSLDDLAAGRIVGRIVLAAVADSGSGAHEG